MNKGTVNYDSLTCHNWFWNQSKTNRFHRFHRFYCFLHVDSHSIQNINPSAYTLVRARTLTIPLQCMECTHLGHCTCCAVNFPPSLPVAKQLPKIVVFKPVLEPKHRHFQKYTSTRTTVWSNIFTSLIDTPIAILCRAHWKSPHTPVHTLTHTAKNWRMNFLLSRGVLVKAYPFVRSASTFASTRNSSPWSAARPHHS